MNIGIYKVVIEIDLIYLMCFIAEMIVNRTKKTIELINGNQAFLVKLNSKRTFINK